MPVVRVADPAPVRKNDRPHKAFELFVPGLGKEVDMASDLIKAMFGKPGKTPTVVTGEVAVQVTDQVGEEAQRLLLVVRGEMTGRERGAAPEVIVDAGLHRL